MQATPPPDRASLPRRLAAAAAAVLSSAGLLSVAMYAASPPTAQAATASCHHIAGPFHSNRAAIFNSAGQRYVPYGINVTGLAHPLTASQIRSRAAMAGTVDADNAVIAAAAGLWCSNTVRLQIEQDYLVAADGTVNRPFLAAIQSEVAYAESLGLVVVLNDQTQLTPAHNGQEFMPTRRSFAFWDSLTSHYKTDPRVVFDLYNEPAFVPTWWQWRNGGVRNGVAFYGMQQLADRVRHRDGARNLLWVEGPHVGGSLQDAWAYRISHDGPLEYAEHRPAGPHTPADWYGLFGYLAVHNLAPVVEGEWADYARTNAGWACWDDAPKSVPVWLRYLADHRIGMIVTKMIPGQLIESANMDDPTHIRSNWSCTTGLNEGAGNQIRNWFSLHNG
jgi:hypothetical protein